MKKKSRIKDILSYFVLIILSLVTILPLAYTIFSSFKSNMEILSNPGNLFPVKPTFENYITAWNSETIDFRRMVTNSLIYTAASVFITLFNALSAGYVFARGNFKGKSIVFGVFTALMFVNFGAITVYPKFEILKAVHLNQSLWGLIFLKFFGLNIVDVFLTKGFICGIPKAIDESAIIDGCSFIGVFFRILLPMITPLLATLALLSFKASWNDYLMPAIFTLTKPEQQTLIVGIMSLKTSGESATSWNLLLAGSTIALVPVLIAYCFANKYFVEGITSGSVKG